MGSPVFAFASGLKDGVMIRPFVVVTVWFHPTDAMFTFVAQADELPLVIVPILKHTGQR